MIAKIGRGENLRGALSYNQLKVEKEKGQILYTHKMMETQNGHYSVSQLSRSFEPYLIANRKTEKTVLHISLNPDPRDQVNDEQFKLIAQDYMQQMGYGNQPYVVFKHTDIERTHIHIVSVCVDEQGRKISDKYERRHSMIVCRNMEKQYGLIPVSEKNKPENNKVFGKVDCKANDLKSQMASVLRHLPQHYQFQTHGEYNALLALYNITAEKVEGQRNGEHRQGMVYFALDESQKKASNPFKATLFGKHLGLTALETHFENSKKILHNSTVRSQLVKSIAEVLQLTTNEQKFSKQLFDKGINLIVRRNDTGRIYGITFIDHNSKTVWNGSRLGKEFSANVFNDWWNHNHKPQIISLETELITTAKTVSDDLNSIEKSHDLFGFLETNDLSFTNESGFISAFGGLLPQAQGEDYEEQTLENQMKKKRKRKRKQ